MAQKKWLGVVGFLLLFYLIIWGFFKLMFSSLGPETDPHRRPAQVIILDVNANRDDAGLLFSYLKRAEDDRVTIVNPVGFMEMAVGSGSVVVIPPSSTTPEWIFAGLTTINQLGEWADSGASVLTFDPLPEAGFMTGNPEKEFLAEGYYDVHFTEGNHNAVLWFDSQMVAPDCPEGASVKATITLGPKKLPVIWKIESGKGQITTCLARPQSTPGASELLRQLVAADSLHPDSPGKRIQPMVFDSSNAATVKLHLEALLTDNQADLISSISWLAQHHYPPARYALVPALFSPNHLVAMAAAQALVDLEAINAIEAIETALRLQPAEIRPVLKQAGEKITESLETRQPAKAKRHN